MDADIKYLWAAQRLVSERVTSPEEFKEVIIDELLSLYDDAWIVETNTIHGRKPAGCLFGIRTGTFTYLSDVMWFPWAGTRNKLECLVGFFNKMRESTIIIGDAPFSEKHVFEYLAKRGVVRRIGTVHGVHDEGSIHYQTR